MKEHYKRTFYLKRQIKISEKEYTAKKRGQLRPLFGVSTL